MDQAAAYRKVQKRRDHTSMQHIWQDCSRLLETELTPALVQEVHSRELINRNQNQRKTQDLDVADRIALTISADAELLAAVEAHRATIAAETLATTIDAVSGAGDVDVNGHLCAIALAKI